MLKVRDLMKRDAFSLPASLSASEAAWAFMHHGVSAAPVRDAGGQLVGFCSNADLIDGTRTGGSAFDATVEEIMTPAVLSVAEDDAAMDAAHMMVEHHIHQVVVLGPTGELAGMVSAMDFLRHFLDEAG